MLFDDFERLGARITAAVFIAGLVGFELRANGSTRGKAAGFGSAALAAGLTIATVKWLISK